MTVSFLLFFCLMVFSYQKESNRPSPQIYHSLIYHTKAHSILFFGGQSEHGWIADLREIWAYDIVSNTWEKVGVYDACPMKGSAQAPAYDSESDRVIVLNTEGETWAYQYDKRLWERRNPSRTPKTRAGHRMVYDSESDRLILFGGFEAKDVNSPVYGETWAYDFNSDTWTLMEPELSPPKRMYHGMAYDSESDRVIVWGGRLLERLDDNSVWSYDFNTDTWTQHKSPDAPQPELTYPGMVYRSASDRMIIFGGAEVITPFDCEVTRQTWTYEFNSNTWSRMAPESTPPSMGIHAMAYDIQNDKIMVFGGEVDRLYSDHILGETWIYDPKNCIWEKIQ
jgi:N-acetylneuraminic acid mutarotase